MTFLEALHDTVDRFDVFAELDVDAAALPSSARGLSDRSVHDLLAHTTSLIRQATLLQSVLAGVASTRSGRERGHGGLVQRTGHRNAVEFVRDVMGTTRGEAVRAVKAGEALLDGIDDEPGSRDQTDAGGTGEGGDHGFVEAAPSALWYEPLRQAMLAESLTTAQYDAIRRGLGEPPAIDGRDEATTVDAWRSAATQLVNEARTCTVEDLAARARTVRDLLDPAGAENRHQARFDQRSYRPWRDRDGVRRASIVYDPEMGEWLEGMFSAALSPRRGGPRFVADDEKTAGEQLVTDPRTNEQLAYDLLVDVLLAGALANAKDVYGGREAGVRLVTMRHTVNGSTAHRDAFGRLVAVACAENGQLVLPGSVLERALCALGTIDVFTDTYGNPLDLGREARLYTTRQKLALGVRDGGCLWPGCDRPPEYCEAHHIDEWSEGGDTDCDRGILLCRWHHLHLHNGGWRVTRDGIEGFLLHPPPHMNGQPIALRSRSSLRWLWDPPPERAGWRTGPSAEGGKLARATASFNTVP